MIKYQPIYYKDNRKKTNTFAYWAYGLWAYNKGYFTKVELDDDFDLEFFREHHLRRITRLEIKLSAIDEVPFLL